MYKGFNFLRVVFVSFFVCTFLLLPSVALLADSHTNPGGGAPNPGQNPGGGAPRPGGFIENPLKLGVDNVYALVELIVKDIIVPLGSVVVVIMIIYSGFLFVVAQGNDTKIANAKMTFFYSVIGAAILLGAWAIAEVIENTVGQVVG